VTALDLVDAPQFSAGLSATGVGFEKTAVAGIVPTVKCSNISFGSTLAA